MHWAAELEAWKPDGQLPVAATKVESVADVHWTAPAVRLWAAAAAVMSERSSARKTAAVQSAQVPALLYWPVCV